MALRQAERLAQAVQADDVVAIACGNQANVAMIRHRYEQALTLAERAVALHQQYPPGHGLAVALGTLGQIAIRLGQLSRAAEALNAALAVRTPLLYHETTGAIFDSLAQIHLIRGDYDACADALAQARDAFGVYDAHTPRWYDWSLRLIDARLTSRRGDFARAVTLADAIAGSPGVPPADQVHAYLIAADALVQAGQHAEAQQRLDRTAGHVDPRTTPGAWGEYLRVRGVVASATGRATEGYHDLSQSATVCDLLGERYQSALSQLALGRVAARAGARSLAVRTLDQAGAIFRELGRGARRARRRGGARVARSARHGRVRRRTRRCRRRRRTAHRRRGGAARAARARDLRGAARDRRGRRGGGAGARRTRRAPRGGARRLRPGVCAIAGARGGPQPAAGRLPRGGRAARTRRAGRRVWPRSPCRARPATWSSGGCAWWAPWRARDSSCATCASVPRGRPTSGRSNGRWSR